MTVKAPTDDAPPATRDGAASAIASVRRAAMADRYAIDSFSVEWRDLGQLGAIVDEWRELIAHALEPNVFYEPAFALPAAAVFGRDAGAVLVWSGTNPRQLLGLFPARVEQRRYGLRLPILAGWTHPFAPLWIPLVARDAAEPVIAAWLAHLAGDSELPGVLLLPYLPQDGPFATALFAVLRRAQMLVSRSNCHSRALLAPPAGDRSDYVEHAVATRKLKELRRIWRRMADRGALLLTDATTSPAVASALEDFLALEAGGWKGKAGTAAADRADVNCFIQTALRALAAERKVSINRILLDGQAMAATITLRSADGAWFWKIAYDEKFARYSPGVMLTVAVTEELLEDASVARTDSCAAPHHPMIDHIWRERLALCDLMVAVRPQAPFAWASRLEILRSGLIRTAKRIRGGHNR